MHNRHLNGQSLLYLGATPRRRLHIICSEDWPAGSSSFQQIHGTHHLPLLPCIISHRFSDPMPFTAKPPKTSAQNQPIIVFLRCVLVVLVLTAMRGRSTLR